MVLICSQSLPNMSTIWNPEDVLDVYPSENRFTCVGTTDLGQRCAGSSIPPASHREARAILHDLRTSSNALSIIKSDGWLFPQLYRLATLTICSNKHRYDCDWHPEWRMGRLYEPEAVLVAHTWFETIRDMPSRLVRGGLRRQPAIPESIAYHFDRARSSTAASVVLSEATSPRNPNAAMTRNTRPETSMFTPGDQPVQAVSQPRMSPSPSMPLATAEDSASTEPFASDLYSATPQTGNIMGQLDPAQVTVLLSEIGPQTDDNRVTVQARSQNDAFEHETPSTTRSDSMSISSLNSLGVLIPSPESARSIMTSSSHGTIADEDSCRRSSTPSLSTRNTTGTTSCPHVPQQSNSLPSNIGGLISAALIKALSGSTSLEDALNTSLIEPAAVATESRTPSVSFQPTLAQRSSESPSVYHTPCQTENSTQPSSSAMPREFPEEITSGHELNPK
jgi:hypothetical protein